MKKFKSYLAVGLSLNIIGNCAGRVFAEEAKTPTVGIPSSGITVDGSFSIKPSEEKESVPPDDGCPKKGKKPEGGGESQIPEPKDSP